MKLKTLIRKAKKASKTELSAEEVIKYMNEAMDEVLVSSGITSEPLNLYGEEREVKEIDQLLLENKKSR